MREHAHEKCDAIFSTLTEKLTFLSALAHSPESLALFTRQRNFV